MIKRAPLFGFEFRDFSPAVNEPNILSNTRSLERNFERKSDLASAIVGEEHGS